MYALTEPKDDEFVLTAGRRLGMFHSADMGDWYVSWSPRNASSCAEGGWADWVDLAKQILAEDEKRKATT